MGALLFRNGIRFPLCYPPPSPRTLPRRPRGPPDLPHNPYHDAYAQTVRFFVAFGRALSFPYRAYYGIPPAPAAMPTPDDVPDAAPDDVPDDATAPVTPPPRRRRLAKEKEMHTPTRAAVRASMQTTSTFADLVHGGTTASLFRVFYVLGPRRPS